mmetsp:Transcript_7376/g.14649  ORF Transcript_7376/g.14649 Transcript_7376/m.14649 type:complete len:156 (-) Transcript_7376:276-743(-)
MAARRLTRSFVSLARQHAVAPRPVAAFMPRFMSARVPIPEPKWEQDKDIHSGEIVPSDMDQATGLERAELLAEAEGRNLFDVQPIGLFGTKENPVVVESIYEERVMGCPGDCANGDTSTHNELQWFVVTKDAPYVCPECSQVFTLKQIEGEEYKF